MSHSESTRPSRLAAEISRPDARQIRTSEKRAEEIKQYIIGLLPAHINERVDVVITPHVETAAVLPATEGALLDGDQTDFSRQQAKQLIEAVDGEYLVLVTGRETPTDAAPLNDQKSADCAHQFGLALHETLHILKTAFNGIQTLLSEDVDDQYEGFVHDLINTTEDGAIEHEVYTGDDFSDRAGYRLRLVREIHKRNPDDYESLPDERSKFTFRDALLQALHDNVILPPSGTTSALIDDSDDRVTFASEEERQAFLEIYNEIEQLADDIHSIRGDESDDVHRNDAEASIQRAKRTIQFWHNVIKPFVDEDANDAQRQRQQQAGQSPQGESDEQDHEQETENENSPVPQTDESGDSNPADQECPEDAAGEQEEDGESEEGTDSGEFDCPDCDRDDLDSEHGRRVHYGKEHGDTDELDEKLEQREETTSDEHDSDSEQSGSGDTDSPSIDDIDPEDLSLDANAVEDSLQELGEHPSIGDEPDPGDVELDPQIGESDVDPDTNPDSPPEQDTSRRDSSATEPPEQSQEDGATTNSEQDAEGQETGPKIEPDRDGAEDTSGSENPSNEPENSNELEAEASEDGSGGGEDETAEVETSSSASTIAPQSAETENEGQATFDDFLGGGDANSSESDAEDSNDDEASGGSESEQSTSHEDSPKNGQPDESDHGEQQVTDDGSAETTTSDDSDGMDFDPSDGEQESPIPQPGGNDGSEGQDESASASTIDSGDSSSSTQDDASGDGHDSRDGAHADQGEQSTRESANPDETASGRDESEQAGSDSSDGPAGDVDEEVTGPDQEGEDLSPEDFESDRERAERTADEISADENALMDELQSLEEALGDEQDTSPDSNGGGSGAGPGSVDELTILPAPNEDDIIETDWGDVEDGADQVANTLAKQLRLDQQTETRTGMCSGTTVNPKTAHRLAYGDPRTFERSIPGDEKEYFIVLVLDRSGSMGRTEYQRRRSEGPSKIRVATSAVARFAVACEDLGIDVAVIDFYDDDARLAKPASVDAEYAQETLLNTEAEGGTPLADGLSLARALADDHSRESIIITMTDDKPADVDDVKTEIKNSISPVCSLTIATDCEEGNPPRKAKELQSRYDQTTTVFNPEKLDDRLDQFASLLGAY